MDLDRDVVYWNPGSSGSQITWAKVRNKFGSPALGVLVHVLVVFMNCADINITW